MPTSSSQYGDTAGLVHAAVVFSEFVCASGLLCERQFPWRHPSPLALKSFHFLFCRVLSPEGRGRIKASCLGQGAHRSLSLSAHCGSLFSFQSTERKSFSADG